MHKKNPSNVLLTIFRNFIRPHLDYGDVAYDQASNTYLIRLLEVIQYNTSWLITGDTKWTSREKLYKELVNKFLNTNERLGAYINLVY